MRAAGTIAMLGLVVALLSGCAAFSSFAKVEVTEGCTIKISGMSAAQASEVIRAWSFSEGCEVEFTSTVVPLPEEPE